MLWVLEALDSHKNGCGVLGIEVKCWFCCWVLAHGSGGCRPWTGFGRHGVSGEATRDVRGVSGMCPEIAEVMVAGSGGSEGGES